MKPEHATFIRRLLDNELAADEQVLSSAQDGVWRAKPASKPKTIAEKKRAAEALASATQWLDECKAKHRLTQDTIAAFEKMVKGWCPHIAAKHRTNQCLFKSSPDETFLVTSAT